MVFNTSDVSLLTSQCGTLTVYQAALLYIVAHEIAHASHGHMEFIASPSFAEFSATAEDRSLTMRALEMDSDSSATSSVFAIFEKLRDMHLMKTAPPLGRSAEEFAKILRKQYVAGIVLSHLYLDTLASNYFPVDHPISYARYLTAAGVLDILFRRHSMSDIEIPEEVRQHLVSSFALLSGDVKFLGHPIASNVMVWDGEEEPKYLYDAIGVLAGLDHLELLHRRWSRLRPCLVPFQRGGILAPAAAEPF